MHIISSNFPKAREMSLHKKKAQKCLAQDATSKRDTKLRDSDLHSHLSERHF